MNDRARVPFAVVGVVLLVGSATVAATLATRAPATDDPATERALEVTAAATTTALQTAATRAAGKAARRPVTAPANTSAGAALNDSGTFREYLGLRIYLAARDHLRAVGQRIGGVRTTVSLPPVEHGRDIRQAKRRVHVEQAGPNGTALRVSVKNVTMTARRNGQVVDRVRLSPSVVVETPVLAVHDRVARFERQLRAAPTEPGMSRRLTARLYALAWARGYVQYGGGPIANVVANRHVEVATNDAVLSTQRDAFGVTDPAARRGLAVAAGRVAVRDVATMAGAPGERTGAILRAAERVATDERVVSDPVQGWGGAGPAPEDEMRVGVNRSADVGFVRMVEGNLTEVLRAVYSARVRPDAHVERVDRRRSGTGRPPGDWTLANERRRTAVRVQGTVAPRPSALDDRSSWHVLQSYGRRLRRETTTRRTWRRGNETRTTRVTRTETFRVTVGILGRHAPSDRAPDRPIETVHERSAGPLDGPNLATVQRRAIERLVADAGGPEVLARRALAGRLDTSPRTVAGERPDRLRRWIVRDLVGLADRVRSIDVRVRRAAVGTQSANPPAELAERLASRRADLLAVPSTYGSVAAKARIATRAAYLDRVRARLERRAARQRRERAGLDRALRDRGLSLAAVGRSLRARRDAGGGSDGGSASKLELSVDGAPPYLTLGRVSRERVGLPGEGTVRPLAARNLNVFTVPYADAVGSVVDFLFDRREVHMRTAARTLQAARVVDGSGNRTLSRRRAELRRELRRANAAVRRRLRGRLRRAGVGRSPADRRDIATGGLTRWPTTAGRAIALANGSAVRAIVAETARRDERFASEPNRTRLRLALGATVDRALTASAGRVSQPVVNRTARAVESVATRKIGRVIEHQRNRRARSALGSLPAGLPVTPVPGSWYATLNVWHVQVRGGYERFTVRANRGRPTPAGATLSYTRAGRAVRLDIDDDGRPELLGRGEAIEFEAETVVVVVVPPGGQGVGDTDGNADERSPGWEGS